jgi:hypothetical protein
MNTFTENQELALYRELLMQHRTDLWYSLLKVGCSEEHLKYYPTSRMFQQHLTQEQFVNIYRQNSRLTNKLNNISMYWLKKQLQTKTLRI